MSFDTDAFGRDLDRAMREVAREGIADLKADLTAAGEAVRSRYTDQGQEEVEEMLRTEFKARDLDMPDEHIGAFAEAIRHGQAIDWELDVTPPGSLD